MTGTEKIWIIGGSSGIGAALAKAFAEEGAIVVISGRNQASLQQVVAPLGPAHGAIAADVTDIESLESAARVHGPFDRIIISAATYDPGAVIAADQDKAEAIIRTNLIGSFNVARVGTGHLRKGGQLVLFGSAAAIFGLPQGQVYSATKAGIVNLAESLRVELWPQVDVRLVTPGFVRTPLTDRNSFDMPAILEPEDAAKRILRGLNGKGFEIAFPRRLIWPLRLLAVLPKPLAFSLTTRLRQ
ncbi:SDR family NAD(P)-dependent oxidoreductase [Devosia faecipullorum]|uniref:SDR family NAD(P)-dependent oxidoreductase n=1 Tax=Devosia faecipullorum TaxID=2755039 RepID=UPI00187B6ABA|nr:SDR family NAD(P)-dependent oxidoreductase [Devosia faecipullorum]MBE7734007.1 SDR family NAD(P)-dependent oxidoreductase [Devosia faecipullorum]